MQFKTHSHGADKTTAKKRLLNRHVDEDLPHIFIFGHNEMQKHCSQFSFNSYNEVSSSSNILIQMSCSMMLWGSTMTHSYSTGFTVHGFMPLMLNADPSIYVSQKKARHKPGSVSKLPILALYYLACSCIWAAFLIPTMVESGYPVLVLWPLWLTRLFCLQNWMLSCMSFRDSCVKFMWNKLWATLTVLKVSCK